VLFENIPGFYCGNHLLNDLITIEGSSIDVDISSCPGLNQPSTITLNEVNLPEGATLLYNGEVPDPSEFRIIQSAKPFIFWVSHF